VEDEAGASALQAAMRRRVSRFASYSYYYACMSLFLLHTFFIPCFFLLALFIVFSWSLFPSASRLSQQVNDKAIGRNWRVGRDRLFFQKGDPNNSRLVANFEGLDEHYILNPNLATYACPEVMRLISFPFLSFHFISFPFLSFHFS